MVLKNKKDHETGGKTANVDPCRRERVRVKSPITTTGFGKHLPVLDKEAIHGGGEGRRVDPVYGVHLLDEGALPDDGSNEVEAED